MIYFLAVCLALVSLGCGSNRVDFGPFGEYEAKFYEAGATAGFQVQIENLTMGWGTLTYPVIGECTPGSHVVVDPSDWAKLDDDQKEVLIFHELGHCVLTQGHRAGVIPDGSGCPASIMSPYLFLGYCYKWHRDYYIHELFTGGG